MTLTTKLRLLAAGLVSIFLVAKHSLFDAVMLLLLISAWAYFMLRIARGR